MARLTVLLTALFLLGHTACAGAEPLGRLFFSPGERARLDQVRNGHASASAPAGQQASTEQITLNGIVRRSSGKTTTWINQVPQNENETPQGITVWQGQTSKPSALLLLPSGKKVNLKAGQTFDTTKGKVREGYEDATGSTPQEAAK
ncbi:MAG: hypothetical protein ACYC2E_16575 [Sulfuricella sp.]